MPASWDLPVPSRELSRPVELVIRRQRVCALLLAWEADGCDQGLEILFQGVESFRCTYPSSQTLLERSATDRVITRAESPYLDAILGQYHPSSEAAALAHYQVTFADGPCYDFICETFTTRDRLP